jgi:heme/copper-type cytochrome/quinol oxidase subunit 2
LSYVHLDGAAEPATGGISKIFAPESTPAKSIFDLSLFVLTITGIILTVVFTLLVYSITKFRAESANADREPARGLWEHADRVGLDHY